MRTVADQAQFVVQIVFTTSSKTVGLRSIRPAPVVTQARSGSWRRPRRRASGPRRGEGRARPASEAARGRRVQAFDRGPRASRGPCDPRRPRTVRGALPSSGSVSSSVQASSSIRFGGRSATPCEAIVRRRSTGSPPRADELQLASCPSSNACRTAYIRRVGILGVDVGGTFTDAVLVEDGRIAHGEGADRRRGRRSPCSRRRARSAPTSSSASRTGRRSRRTRCSSARARARPSSRPRASSTCCTCAARTARTSTGSASDHPEPLVPLERCFGVRRANRAGGRARAARPRLAARDRRGGGRGLPALLVPRPEPRAAVADELRRRLPGARVVASHEVAPEFREYERASTTAIDAYLGPVLARYLERARGALRRGRACRSRSSCAPPAASRRSRRRLPIPPFALALRPGRRRRRRRDRPRGRRASRTRSPSTWAGRRPTLPDQRRARPSALASATSAGLPGAPAERRPAHRRRRRRLDRLGGRGRRAARRARERRRRARGRPATGRAGRGRP